MRTKFSRQSVPQCRLSIVPWFQPPHPATCTGQEAPSALGVRRVSRANSAWEVQEVEKEMQHCASGRETAAGGCGLRAAFPAADLEEACSARIARQLRRGGGPRVGREGKRNGRLPLTEGTNASLSTQVSKKYSSQQHRVCVCV